MNPKHRTNSRSLGSIRAARWIADSVTVGVESGLLTTGIHGRTARTRRRTRYLSGPLNFAIRRSALANSCPPRTMAGPG